VAGGERACVIMKGGERGCALASTPISNLLYIEHEFDATFFMCALSFGQIPVPEPYMHAGKPSPHVPSECNLD